LLLQLLLCCFLGVYLLTLVPLQNAIKAKIDSVQPSKDKASQSPLQKRKQELIAQANEIKQKQQGGKNARTSKQEQIKRLDEQLRSRIAEQKAARGKVAFKSVEDVDREINRLDAQVNGGMMKLVDEKKALAEISNLRKQRKNFSQFDDAQKQIDDLRTKIKEIKDSMDDPEAKALSEQYNKIQSEIDVIKAEQDEAYKNLSSLRDERTKLQKEQSEKFQAIRQLKDEYHTQRKAFAEYDRNRRQAEREKKQAEYERIQKERKMERAKKMLAEASDPAYLEEIRRADSLLRFFDPSHVSEKSGPLLADKGLAAQAIRKVEDAAIKGMKVLKKEDEDYFAPAKKGKKGKKSTPTADANSKFFNVPPSVIEDCAFVGVDPPMSSADVPTVTEKVKAKLEQWKADQPEQTKKVRSPPLGA
jgi:chromosome segregation ATPase